MGRKNRKRRGQPFHFQSGPLRTADSVIGQTIRDFENSFRGANRNGETDLTVFSSPSAIFLRKLTTDEERLMSASYIKRHSIKLERLKPIEQITTKELIDATFRDPIHTLSEESTKTGEILSVEKHKLQPYKLSILSDFPLYGLQDQPFGKITIDRHTLFDLDNDQKKLDLSSWLSQIILNINSKDISLKKIIQKVASFESAHPGGVGYEIEQDWQILYCLHYGSVRYVHIVVIATALYIYSKLRKQPKIKLNSDSGEEIHLSLSEFNFIFQKQTQKEMIEDKIEIKVSNKR